MSRLEAVAAMCDRMRRVFACPVCAGPMSVGGERRTSVICDSGHCFDFSARGYLNLLLAHQRRSSNPGYDAGTAEARRATFQTGLLDPLCDAVAESVARPARRDLAELTFLDAGCGEGYVLSSVLLRLRDRQSPPVQAIGVDISKPAVALACKHDRSVIWCIANIAKRLPFVEAAFDVAMNVLAPSNVPEYRRVLRRGGLLLQVVAMENHLIELRQALYERPRDRPCPAQDAMTELSACFGAVETQRATYETVVPEGTTRTLIQMTPLHWKAKRDRIEALQRTGLAKVTVDLLLIAGVAC